MPDWAAGSSGFSDGRQSEWRRPVQHKQVIIALDLGTTSNRAIAFNSDGAIVCHAHRELTQYYPQPGWVEHDPVELYRTALEVLREAVDKTGAESVAAIGITNQRETSIVWDRFTGEPLYRAIVWQDRRTADRCEEIGPAAKEIKNKTGLMVDPYFSATKIAWILDRADPSRVRAGRGELLFGTPETWVLWNLTKKTVHATEPSNASRTMLYNIRTLTWDGELLNLFGIPAPMLPQVHNSDALFGATERSLFGRPIPVTGIAGDQQASLFGQRGFDGSTVKVTYGTGIFMMVNTADTPLYSDRLVTTVAWKRGGCTSYALEGSIFMGGASIQWLRDNLGIITTAAQSGSDVIASTGNEGVYLVPAFQGLGAPYWNSDARGLLIGLSRKTNAATIIRAAVESMAYQVRDVLEEFISASKAVPSFPPSFRLIHADGGATENRILMQFQADLLGIPVIRSRNTEITSFGVAAIAAIACGFWDEKQFLSIVSDAETFTPNPSRDCALHERYYQGWLRAVKRSLDWET